MEGREEEEEEKEEEEEQAEEEEEDAKEEEDKEKTRTRRRGGCISLIRIDDNIDNRSTSLVSIMLAVACITTMVVTI